MAVERSYLTAVSVSLQVGSIGACSSNRSMSDDGSSGKSEDVCVRRVKLMCSFGGKILPRPHDNQLRYVGGETHILVVSRNISFADLMSKFAKLYGGSAVCKYQLPDDELDVLVSILGDEDLDIMMEEFEKLYSKDSSARIRIFLFPLSQRNFLQPLEYTRDPEQQFMDAVNGLSFVSKRNSYPFTCSQGFDFLFGLDALAKQGGKSTNASLKSSLSYSTAPALPVSLSGKDFISPLHSGALSQQVASITRQENTSDKHINDDSVKSKPIASTHVMTVQTDQYSADNDQSNTRTYPPLVEASRDQLSKGTISRQHDDSLTGSSDSPVFRHISGDDLSDFSDLSLEEMYDRISIIHSHCKDCARSPGKETMVSVFPKNLRDHLEGPMDMINGPKMSFGLRGRSSSDGRLNLLDSNAEYLSSEHRHNGTDLGRAFFIDHHNQDINLGTGQWISDSTLKKYHNLDMSSTAGQWISDSTLQKHHNLDMRSSAGQSISDSNLNKHHTLDMNSSAGQWISDSNVDKAMIQRREADRMISSNYGRQTMQNQMSGLSYWQADDDRHHYPEALEVVPQNLVFLPRPGLTHTPAQPSFMPRVSSAPNFMKLSSDALPPRYVPAPLSNQQPSRQIYDKQIQAHRFVPSAARAAHRSPSRFRDSSPVGSREQS